MEKSKTCQQCLSSKPAKDFHKDSTRVDGYNYICKECRSTHRHAYYEKNKERIREQYDPVRNRQQMLQRNYGIGIEDYQQMYDQQDGKCLVCLSWCELLHVDHCHDTGVVRGLLCSPCNLALGLLRDNPANLARAIDYLGDI